MKNWKTKYRIQYIITLVVFASWVVPFTWLILLPIMLLTGADWDEAKNTAIIITKDLTEY